MEHVKVRHVVTTLALVLTLLLPRVALASTLVGSYNIPTDADNVACDWFGYDYNTMDSGLRALLHSSTTTGGAGTDANPNFAGYAAFRNSLFSPAVAGDYQWYSRYDGFMFVDAADKARADIEGAIRWWDEYGTDSGGGSGSNTIPNPIVCNGVLGTFPNGMVNDTSVVGHTATLSYNGNSNIFEHLDMTKYHEFFVINGNGGKSIVVAEADSASDIVVTTTMTQEGGRYTPNQYRVQIGGTNVKTATVTNGNYSGSTADISFDLTYVNALTSSGYSKIYVTWMYRSSGSSGGGPTGGPVPPETPTTPEVNEQPTYNNIYNINGSLNIDNSTTGETEFELDLSELLDILKTINNNLVSFAEDFHDMWDWWAEEMGVIESDMRKFQDVITTWLQMIYNKISSGNSSKPDVYVNPDNGLNWFEEILARLLEAMPEGIQELITTLAELRGVFPFSIPWDLGLILSTLAGQPVTPVVDIPYPYGLNRISYIRVDLTPWDGVAYQIRRGLFIVFAGGLALNTKKLLGLVEVN